MITELIQYRFAKSMQKKFAKQDILNNFKMVILKGNLYGWQKSGKKTNR